jgi:sugar phosphate isomerase/epimerase
VDQITINRASLKGRFPFRLGTTSYILPDALLPNVRFLAPQVDDIELILFESEAMSNLPGSEDIDELLHLAKAHNLSYTVHLPLDVELGHPDEARRQESLRLCRRTVEATQSLSPHAYLLHLSHPAGRAPIPASDRKRWKAALRLSLDALLGAGSPQPRAFCVETLSYPLEWVEDLIADYDLSVCLDIGHLLLAGISLDTAFRRFETRTRVLHVHGIEAGTDHRSISHLAESDLALLRSWLMQPERHDVVATIEVFDPDSFAGSWPVLESWK